jgi:hypothetical protein
MCQGLKYVGLKAAKGIRHHVNDNNIRIFDFSNLDSEQAENVDAVSKGVPAEPLLDSDFQRSGSNAFAQDCLPQRRRGKNNIRAALVCCPINKLK